MHSVLSVETSCDESAAAVIQSHEGKFEVLSNEVSSQMKIHAKWGGVIPEMASRIHVEALPYLIEGALKTSGLDFSQIDGIAATVAPGLTGCLLVGSVAARTLSRFYGLPFIGVHHLEGHLASIYLSNQIPSYPFLVLLVSGGHTELIKVSDKCNYLRLGKSHDDAAGEAFDKVARLLKLSYPGGPSIEKAAIDGDRYRFSFPKGRVSNPLGGFYPYDFSFSGVKTAVMREVDLLAKEQDSIIPVKDIAASFERAIAEVLVERTLKCAIDHDINSIVVVGGVAANTFLREKISSKANECSKNVFFPPKTYCTDNAAMIGAAALWRLESRLTSSIELGVKARLPLEEADSLYSERPSF